MTVQRDAIQVTTDSFRIGMQMGRDGIYRGKLPVTLTEEDIVGIVRNLVQVAQEGWLSELQLRQDVGIIVGVLTK